jgi:phage antirepressor YoqD-like protein
MSSREIADLVEARHNDVIATVDRLFSKGLLRSSRETRKEATGGRPIEVYDLIERDTHLVVSGYSDEHRAKVIDRWQELETKQALKLPASFAQALRLAAEQAERIEQQQAALAIAAPKAEFVDNYVDGTGLKGFRQVAKLLNANEPDFRLFLQDSKIMYRLGGEWMPYAAHVDAERFAVKTGQADNGHAFNTAKFTPKGIAWVAGLWAQHQLEVAS